MLADASEDGVDEAEIGIDELRVAVVVSTTRSTVRVNVNVVAIVVRPSVCAAAFWKRAAAPSAVAPQARICIGRCWRSRDGDLNLQPGMWVAK